MVNRAPLDILFGIEIKGSGEQQSYTKKELFQGIYGLDNTEAGRMWPLRKGTLFLHSSRQH